MAKHDNAHAERAGRENKPHIGIFGRCNSGKSTLLNFIVGADTAIVSPESGTTTDVVRKSYEIRGFAPVIFIDTAGIDDTSPLGRKRVARTVEAMRQVDLALLVYREWGAPEERLLKQLNDINVPVIIVRNEGSPEGGSAAHGRGKGGCEGTVHDGIAPKGRNPAVGNARESENIREAGKIPGEWETCGSATDGLAAGGNKAEASKADGSTSHEFSVEINGFRIIAVDAAAGGTAQRDLLVEEIKRRLPENSYAAPSMFGDRVKEGDMVLLVCPIDSAAPAGRMILPQVQAIRELMDKHAVAVVVQPAETGRVFAGGARPVLVVTDSQVFPEVRRAVPSDVEVTSFSILLAAAKGDYALYLAGLEKVDALRRGDRILITESCTHQVSCEDIGRVKIPRWLEEYTGVELEFDTVSGLAPLPEDLSRYALMIQCGACMVTRSQLHNRLRQAADAGVPVTNYGMLIRKIRK